MSDPRTILALAVNYHDSCVALLRDRVLVEVLELERLTRTKHVRESLLADPVRQMLNRHHIGFNDVDVVATCLHGGLPEGFEWSFNDKPYDARRSPEKLMGWGHVSLDGIKRPACAIRHHAAHAAATLYASGFRDNTLVLTFDGGGDHETFVVFAVDGQQLRFCDSRPLNFGVLFTILGWLFFGLEARTAAGKLMAYAALAEPDAQLIQQLCGLFSMCERDSIVRSAHLREALLGFGLKPACFMVDSPDARVFMASFQRAFEEYLLGVLKTTTAKFPSRTRLCLSGGCALNCVANTRIAKELSFKEVFVPPCCHDGGIAAGLALFAHSQVIAPGSSVTFPVPYLGRAYELNRELVPGWASILHLGSGVFEWTAERLASGATVGWFQGRSETGPRALGNRSILARPDRRDIAEHLNRDIKQREWYRPFAPVVLADSYARYFEGPANDFMSFAAKCRDASLPGVSHADGTSRVQVLRPGCNSSLEHLIAAFDDLTGLPVLLNTSFNGRGEPIVESPTDAFRLLQRSPLDAVIIGDCAVVREESHP